MFKPTLFHQMRTDESCNFGLRMIDICEPYNLTELASTLVPVKESANKLKVHLARVTHKDKTEAVEIADQVRDNSFLSLRSFLESLLYRRDAKLVAAATRLLETIRGFGWNLHLESYSTESSRLKGLIAELTTNPELIEAAAIAGISSHITELIEAEDGYEAIYLDRDKAKAAKPDTTGVEISKQLRVACNDLLQTIAVLHRTTGRAEYAEMARRINEVIDAQAQVIRARLTRAANAKLSDKNSSDS